MALQSQAQLLDELMGKNRNVAPGARINAVRFDDEDVCKYMLCGLCPHDLFVNTRADLGACNKIHDEELRKQYEKSSRYGRLGYEDDYERYLRSLLNDVERKIKRGNERLRLTQNDSVAQKAAIQQKQEKVDALKEQINSMLNEAERLGEECKIEESQEVFTECEKLKAECKYLENQIEMALNNADQKQMQVCDVCGSFLIVNDAQSRVEEHISGKQHQGFAKLRGALDELKKKRQEEYEKKEKERKERSSSRRDDDRNRDRYKDDRNKDRDRDRRDRDRDRDRDRNREREKDRDHERNKYREKERESNGRKKSRSRSRSPNRKKSESSKDQDRERTKRNRSHSRDREYQQKHLKAESNREKSTDTLESKEDKMKKLEQQTEEFMKLVENLTKKKERAEDEEKEEGEEDDEMDEGEIRSV